MFGFLGSHIHRRFSWEVVESLAHLAYAKKRRQPALHSLTITPLGGLNIDLMYVQHGPPEEKPKVVAGKVDVQRGKLGVKLTDIGLDQKPVKGTPDPSGQVAPGNTAQTFLRSPILSLDPKTGRISGSAVLVIEDSQYPKGRVAPTELRLFVKTDPPKLSFGKLPRPGITGYAEAGPAQINFKLKLNYNTGQLVQAGLTKNLLGELTNPGFDLSGVLQFAIIKNIPVLNKLLRTRFSASSPSTKPLANPLSDAPASYPLKYRVDGIIPVPAGAIFETASLGLGAMGAGWGASRGYSYTVGVLGVPSPTKLTSEFSAYLYLDGYYVEKLSDGWELSVRLSVSAGKTFGADKDKTTNVVEQWRQLSHKAWLPTSKENPAASNEKPMFLGTATLKYRF